MAGGGEKGFLMGRLVWLMGSSGAGKAPLLAALRQREHSHVLVAHRYITRTPTSGNANHIVLSEKEFFTRAEQKLFSLSWRAHGCYYGIGAEIDIWLDAGFDVVVNGSYRHFSQASAKYGSLLLPIDVQVTPGMLHQSLKRQNRKNATEIAARLKRATRSPPPHTCLTITHDGNLHRSVEELISLIHTHQF